MPKCIETEKKRLYEQLNIELNHYRKGDVFLSTRNIMKKFNASRRTMEKVLFQLQNEGQVTIEPSLGILVNRNRNKEIKNIVSIHPDWPSEYWYNLDLAIEEELKLRSNYKFSRALYSPESIRDYLDLINDRMGDAILLPHPLGMGSVSEIIHVLSSSVPIIFMADNIYCAGINAISTQPEYTGMLAAKHLIDKGHRKIALIISEPLTSGEDRKNTGFINMLKISGITPTIIDCKVKRGDASRGKTCDTMLGYFKANGATFTGCFAMSDFSAYGVIDAVNYYGLEVPRNISVIGCYGGIHGEKNNIPLTTITHNFIEIASIVADGLNDLFSGGLFGIRKVHSVLVERGTVKDLKNTRSMK